MCHFPTVFPPDEGCDEVHVVDHDGQRIEVSPDMLPILVGELVDYMTPEQKRDLASRLAQDLVALRPVAEVDLLRRNLREITNGFQTSGWDAFAEHEHLHLVAADPATIEVLLDQIDAKDAELKQLRLGRVVSLGHGSVSAVTFTEPPDRPGEDE